MKKTSLLLISAVFLGACGGAAPVVTNQQTDGPQNPSSTTGSETVAAHSADGRIKPAGVTEPAAPGGGEKTGWTRGGNPIDTTALDSAIKSAEAKVKASPSDESSKKALSQAYYNRAVALTEARQYASALGDYRRAVKYDASNTDAKDWIDKIIIIYDGLNKAYPKEGEEPPPLEYKPGS